jgi:hypothetical protein
MSKKKKTPRSKNPDTKGRQTAAGSVGDSTPKQALPTEDDIDVRREFAEAQRAGTEPQTKKLLQQMQGSGSSPVLSAMDLDADWQRAEPVGEETVGGSVATPGQNVVDDIGEALGVTYADESPVTPGDVVAARDRRRWELDPASSEDYQERTAEIERGRAESKDEAVADQERKDQAA